MTEKELRSLGKIQLLELLHEQEKEITKLTRERDRYKKKLEERQALFSEIGSLAEASLAVTGVFKAAQSSADMYLDNIRNLEAGGRAEAERIVAEAQREADQLLGDARRKTEDMVSRAEQHCQMVQTREKETTDAMWTEVHTRLEQYIRAHAGLKELLHRGSLLPDGAIVLDGRDAQG